ncbi:MAG: hypothetical protein ABIF87_05845 [Pseudomonadota bacterium]
MNEYQRLVDEVKNTNQLYEALKTKVNDEFVKKIAGLWGCRPDVIIVAYESPEYHDNNDGIIWNFKLVIQIIAPDHSVSIPVSGFSLTAFKKTALEDPLQITYTGAGQGATIENLSNAIFQKVKKVIDKASWL